MFVSLVATALAAAPGSTCEPDAAVQDAFDRIEALGHDDAGREAAKKLLEPLVRERPRDFLVHRRWQDLRSRREYDAVREEYRKLATNDDPVYAALYGRLLERSDPKMALEMKQRAVTLDPKFPWGHFELVWTLMWRESRDVAQAKKHYLEFRELCPGSLELWYKVRDIGDAALVRSEAKRLRALLESRTDAHAMEAYSELWALEFQARPMKDHGAVRQQVAADMKRIREKVTLPSRRLLLRTLKTGHQMLGDSEGEKAIDGEVAARFPDSNEALFATMEAWNKANPRPKGDDAAANKAYQETLLKASNEWCARWPKAGGPAMGRLWTLSALDDAPKTEVEAAVDHAVRIAEPSDPHFNPFVLAASLLDRHGLRTEQVPELVKRGLERAERQAKEQARHLAGMPPKMQENIKGEHERARLEAWTILVPAHLRRGDLGAARAVAAEMKSALEAKSAAPAGDEMAKRERAVREATYLQAMGRIARAEGRKADAVSWLLRAAAVSPRRSPESEQRPHHPLREAEAVWKELGGSAEAFAALQQRDEKKIAPQTDWEKRDKALPELALPDLKGRTWKLADLRGKVTFINIWATWCGPCVEEMPHLKKLHARLRDRKDVLVLALNVDDNLGVIEPFVKKHGIEFPVLPALEYQEKLDAFAIPVNLVVGRDGVIRYERLGFGGDGDKWVAEALKVVDEVRGAKRAPVGRASPARARRGGGS